MPPTIPDPPPPPDAAYEAAARALAAWRTPPHGDLALDAERAAAVALTAAAPVLYASWEAEQRRQAGWCTRHGMVDCYGTTDECADAARRRAVWLTTHPSGR